MAGKNVIEGIRSEVEKLGLELMELDQGTYGSGFLLIGVVEYYPKGLDSFGGPVYIKEFFDQVGAVKDYIDLIGSCNLPVEVSD